MAGQSEAGRKDARRRPAPPNAGRGAVAGDGAGSALDPAIRAEMQGRFAHDFGQVRIHRDDRARSTARALGADAVTTGSDIAMGSGNADRALIAHELAHVVQQGRPGPAAPLDRVEAEAQGAADAVAAGDPAVVALRAPAGGPLRQAAPAPTGERTRARGTVRTLLAPDLGRLTGRQRIDQGLEPGQTMDRGTTEAKLQSEIALWRPLMPEWTDVEGMGRYDSWFYGQPGLFDFRGNQMAGWEVNYYFVSMAMAHQGWDWNEAQAIIWTWNSSQSMGIVPGGGDMTPEMWFAAEQGFRDEQTRMAREALARPGAQPGASTGPSPAPATAGGTAPTP